jgi:predicted AAA+ superfamily ATPase
VGTGIMVNSGHLLENLVFNALRRLSADIFYYKTRSGKEVDFIMQMPDRSRMLFQVCDSLIDPQTRKREVNALMEAMRELDLNSGTIVTRNDDEILDTESGRIEIVPVWRFVLTKNK